MQVDADNYNFELICLVLDFGSGIKAIKIGRKSHLRGTIFSGLSETAAGIFVFRPDKKRDCHHDLQEEYCPEGIGKTERISI